MAAISIQNVTLQFGTQTVLQNVSLELQRGEIAGLVGDNGSGKTTLLKLAQRKLQPDTGTVTCERGLDIGYLEQTPVFTPGLTLYEEVGSAIAEALALEDQLHDAAEEMATLHDDPRLHELMEQYERINARFLAAGGHGAKVRIDEILGGLGFTPADYAKPMTVLSGGQKCRAALAKLLLSNQSFLLLDEPTNHLDIDATRWLEKFLAGHKGGAVIISHDRYLLDRLCDRIIEVARKQVSSFPGNYTNYAQTRELRALTREREFAKDSEFIRKERAYIAKHLAGQRTKQAQGRRTRLERQLKAGELVTDVSTDRKVAKLSFDRVGEQIGIALRVEELTMGFDDFELFADLSFQVHAGQRLGITGPNGSGKTTMLKILLGQLTAKSGSFIIDPKLRIGYYSQDHAELDPKRKVVDEIRAQRPEFSEQDARSLLGRFLFTGNDVFKPMGLLSGGEKARVHLAKLILESPDVLILDEPTNHLDIRSRESLESALQEFPGTILVVSHDRYFLDGLVERLLVLRSQTSAVYEGNYTYYLEKTETQDGAAKSGAKSSNKKKKGRKGKGRNARASASPYDALSIIELEELVVRHETDLAKMHERFGDPRVNRDPKALRELKEQAATLEKELTAVDTAWQRRADAQ